MKHTFSIIFLALLLATPGVALGMVQQGPPTNEDFQRQEAQERFIQGLTLAFFEEHEDALKAFQEALRLAGDSPAILSATSASLAALGEIESAIFHAQRAHDADPSRWHYADQLSALLASEQRLDEAVRLLDQFIASQGNHKGALIRLGNTHVSSGQPGEAALAFRQLEAFSSLSNEEWGVWWEFELIYGNPLSQIRTLNHRLSHPPFDSALVDALATRYSDQGNLQSAIDLLERVQQHQPLAEAQLRQLATSYEAVGRHEDAAALAVTLPVNTALSVVEIMSEAGRLLDEGGTQQAISLLQSALAAEPANLELHMLAGHAYWVAGQFDEAAERYLTTAQADPRRLEAWELAGTAYVASGNYQEALASMNEALLLYPGQVAFLRLSAMAKLEQQEWAEAEQFLNEALLYSPDASTEEQAKLMAALSFFHAERENLEEAARTAAHAYGLTPGLAAALTAHGNALHLAGQSRQAGPLLQEALRDPMASARTWTYLGDVLQALGEQEEAMATWEAGLERFPHFAALRTRVESQ